MESVFKWVMATFVRLKSSFGVNHRVSGGRGTLRRQSGPHQGRDRLAILFPATGKRWGCGALGAPLGASFSHQLRTAGLVSGGQGPSEAQTPVFGLSAPKG